MGHGTDLNASQGESTFEYTKRMYKEVEELKNIMPDIFPREVDRFRDQMERYIFHKKRVCNGEFSTFALATMKPLLILSMQVLICSANLIQKKKIMFQGAKSAFK